MSKPAVFRSVMINAAVIVKMLWFSLFMEKLCYLCSNSIRDVHPVLNKLL